MPPARTKTKPSKDELDPIDWASMKPLYEGGRMGLRPMARQFGCSHTAIIKHAREFGWTRSLKEAIAARAEEILVSTPVPTLGVTTSVTGQPETPAKPTPTERATVEVNAQALAIVRQSHRTIGHEVRLLANQLLIELRGSVQAPEVAAQAIDMLRGALEADEHVTGEPPDREVMSDISKAVGMLASLPQRVTVLKNLVDALHKLIGMEREAWGLNTDAGTGGRPLVLVKDFTGRGDKDAPPRDAGDFGGED